MPTESFNILCRFTSKVLFAASIECAADAAYGFKLGLAVKAAVIARADLVDANLAGAYLAGADLVDANLARADLVDANLAGADLAGANLAGAYLAGADLAGAYLVDANLAGAYLAGADLAGANLAGADLAGADLAGANLARADLVDANLAGAKRTELAIARTRILAEGAIVGWKKCQNDVIVKLTVPAEAKRSHAFGRKCRAEYADVIEVIGAKTGTSLYDGKTKYTPGSRVTCDTWCDDWRIECGGGIHFYITREEAEAHS